jgi:hypothetical protein
MARVDATYMKTPWTEMEVGQELCRRLPKWRRYSRMGFHWLYHRTPNQPTVRTLVPRPGQWRVTKFSVREDFQNQ